METIRDGKFRIAGELSIIELHQNSETKGDESVEKKEGKVINLSERRGDKNKEPKLGRVYMATLEGKNHMQRGRRPVVVVQNDKGNQFSTNIQVIPLTTSNTKASMPTHVALPASECGLPKNSIAQCELQTIIDKSQLEEYITELPRKYMGRIGARSQINTPSLAYLSDAEILNLMGLIREKNHIVRNNRINTNPNPKTAA